MVLRNMFSMTGLNVVKAVSSLVVSTMMAGLVPPEKYGLIAFAIPLMGFITLLTDLGLTSAIVRHPELSGEQAGAAVALLGIAGLLGGLVLAALAIPIEHGLHLAGIMPVLWGFSLVTAFSIWAAAPRALLERKLIYPRIAMIEATALAAAILTFTAGVKLALGILSLVAFHIVLQGIRAGGFLFAARGAFTLNLAVSSISALMRIGGWIFLSNLLAFSARNVDRFMIGSFIGAASLGLYSLGYQFMTVPLVLVTWPVSGVLLSTLARMAGDRSRKADVICAIVTGTVALSFPMMTFLLFGADFPVDHYLSHHWVGVTAIIATLAPVGAIQSIAAYNGAILVEKGAVRLNFYLSLLSSVSLSGVFVLAVWLGLMALVESYAVVSILVSLVIIYFMFREADIGARRFLSCLVPGSLASISGVLGVTMLTGLSSTSLANWLCTVLVYVTFSLFAFALDRHRLLRCLRVLTASTEPALSAAMS